MPEIANPVAKTAEQIQVLALQKAAEEEGERMAREQDFLREAAAEAGRSAKEDAGRIAKAASNREAS